MPILRPISDPETSLAEIAKSMEIWEEMNFENEIYQKLAEAHAEARSTSQRLSHTEVFEPLRQKIAS